MANQPPAPKRPTGIDHELQDESLHWLRGGPTEPIETKHPPGLWVLFITEMWERFSYYGMRAILVLYLIASTAAFLEGGEANTNPGFGWTEADAYVLYGVYTFMVYLTAIFGGVLADRFLGTHRSMLVGGWIIAGGHIMLAATEFSGVTVGEAVTFQTSPGALVTFLLGLSMIIVGTGFFKPCVSVMVGQLYREHDPRRDSGFTIFYMGINLGAFLSPLVAGTLGETIGWHWGFGSAAVGMITGLTFYQIYRAKYLREIGLAPPNRGEAGRSLAVAAALISGMVAIPLVPLLLWWTGGLGSIVEFWGSITETNTQQTIAFIVITGAIVAAILWFIFAQRKGERGPLGVIFILAFLGNIFFWAAFEQAGSSMTVFAAEETDRTIGGMLEGDGFPASWYQSVNPLCILIFAPVFAWLWVWLARKRLNPSTPMKFAWGLWLLGLAFLAMVVGAIDAREGLAGPQWLLITYIVVTWGELCLSPVGLSMVTKLSPARLQSFMMGVWFFTFALSNLLAGIVARFSTKFLPDLETGAPAELEFFGMEGLPGFFMMLVVGPFAAGILILVLTPVLKRMMKGME